MIPKPLLGASRASAPQGKTLLCSKSLRDLRTAFVNNEYLVLIIMISGCLISRRAKDASAVDGIALFPVTLDSRRSPSCLNTKAHIANTEGRADCVTVIGRPSLNREDFAFRRLVGRATSSEGRGESLDEFCLVSFRESPLFGVSGAILLVPVQLLHPAALLTDPGSN